MRLTPRHWLLALGGLLAGAALVGGLLSLRGTFSGGSSVYGAPPAAAEIPAPSVTSTAAPAASRTFTLAQAATAAERAAGGRAVKADLERKFAGPAYDVTVLRGDGTTYEVIVDAASGRVLRTSPEDSDGLPDDLED